MEIIAPTDRDYCVRSSLWATGLIMQRNYQKAIPIFMKIIDNCRLTSFYQIKTPDYKWSNSGSEDPKSDTLLKRPTYWLYHNILKYIKLDLYKGLNGDQFRALFMVMWFFKHDALVRLIWKKIFWGFVFRLGFTPSLCEWMPIKPQAYTLFFKIAPGAYKLLCSPIYLICKLFFWLSYNRNIYKIPIRKDTSNKISSIPTGAILNRKTVNKLDPLLIQTIYEKYFGSRKEFEESKHIKSDLYFIGEELIKGLNNYKEK